MRPNEFLVGTRYRNRNGWYEVIEISDGKLHVIFDSGEERDLDPVFAARIFTHMELDDADQIPPGIPKGAEADFAYTLGILAKCGELNAEVPPQSWRGFAQDYRAATQVRDIDQVEGLFSIAHGGDNKWGSELRIYLPEEATSHPRFVLPNNLNIVSGNEPSRLRINHNAFWWYLVRSMNFVCGNRQNLDRIADAIPEDLRSDFREGSAI